MKNTKYLFSIFYIIFLSLFVSCSTSIKITASKTDTQNYSVSIQLGQIISDAIKEAASGISEIDSKANPNSNLVLFDTQSIKKVLEESSFSNIKVSSPEFSKLEFSATGKLEEIIYCTQNSLEVKLNKNNIKSFISIFPQETQSFLDLLMAPVLTGEEMTSSDYIDLVAVVYGEPIAEELKKSTIDLILVSPKGISKTFKIPLVDLLTLNEEKNFFIKF